MNRARDIIVVVVVVIVQKTLVLASVTRTTMVLIFIDVRRAIVKPTNSLCDIGLSVVLKGYKPLFFFLFYCIFILLSAIGQILYTRDYTIHLKLVIVRHAQNVNLSIPTSP